MHKWEININTCEVQDWCHQAQDSDQWQIHVKAVSKLPEPYFLISWIRTDLTTKTVFHGLC
jgi:hypothetical protein